MRIVLRVTLQVYEKTPPFPFHKRIHSALDGPSQYGITTGLQRVRSHFVPSGMRKADPAVRVADEGVVAGFTEGENTELLISQRLPADAIAVENTSVRRQAKQNRRNSVGFRPVQNIRQHRPIRFIAQVRLP